MADEQKQDKTEQATPKRREDARKKGDVPRSRELTMTGVMLTGAASLLLMSAPFAEKVLSGFSGSFIIDRDRIFDVDYLPEALDNTFSEHGKPDGKRVPIVGRRVDDVACFA